ncbi:glycerol-3-phosphate dehydrogenase [NAD(P)+] [Halobacteriovorax marinus SJ]|uniref:Glycerol-3-phosphate dehydrogenase [NAD(P)+] n=1 Tax=Halobacteriovorax marinus (strain ATCC BAA-682 / DSM 15412 / SJ) TaxID=862908 RepID=E1X5J7_HALMS|nr:NAD(P)H-dependent glycerol-3-phosphate dehydrogenase [Halobacteriovorax marinus]CBW27318.1 glycerol-3-phosphate dehydrogenase [NAD(P)+] [Halobacteriovorax marinus SJ]
MKYDYALVVGAGAFGTSIASVLANNFKNVILKVRSVDVYESLLKGSNEVYLPGINLADNIVPALTWEEVDEKAKGKVEIIVSGLPTAGINDFFKENYERFTKYFEQEIPLVSLSKGIDPQTLEMADDLFFDLWNEYKEQFIFLSGPSFAKEILQEQVTLVTAAGRSKHNLESISKMLDTTYFKVLPSYDVKGVLLGGALKNILAIAGGIIEGLGYNHNTRAAMITRGIAEMLRFGKVFNARPETFYGLSGMGDLILTTTGELSRNKTFGLEIAKGRSAEEIINSQRTVVEGYKTAKAVHLLCEKYAIRANIFQGVYKVLYENAVPGDVLKKLMNQPSKFELD